MSCSLILVVLSVIGYFWSGGLTLCLLFAAGFAGLLEHEAGRAAMTPWERAREESERQYYAGLRRARDAARTAGRR